jgi:endonuclease/exonuclease/phosphatase family metal-dependent hydrolase
MTLNIWNLSGPWRERRGEILRWFEHVAPDVVCLQEVVDDGAGRNQAEWLAEQSGGWHVAYGGAPLPGDDGPARFGNAVLSRQPIDDQHTDELPYEPRPDDIQRVVVHARTAGIDVFSTHLNWRYEDGYIRERQVVRLDEVIATHATPDSPLPPILAGDFNAEPDSTEIRFLSGLTSINGRSTYLQEAWRVAGGRGPGFTWDNRSPFAAAELEPDRRIDYIFVGWRRPGGAGRIESTRVVCDRSLTGTFATDHFGVVADIQT